MAFIAGSNTVMNLSGIVANTFVYPSSGTGDREYKVNPSTAGSGDRIGQGFDVGCGKVVAGARNDDDNGTNAGAMYIFDLQGNNEIKVTASDASSSDLFGRDVAIGSGRIVVGADDAGPSPGGPGKAYVYDLNGGNEVILTASDGVSGDDYGFQVGAGSGRVGVAAPLDTTNVGSF